MADKLPSPSQGLGEGNQLAADSSGDLRKEEVVKLVNIFESRLSFVLLQFVKLLSSKKKSR